jgi:hypothetical protein
MKGLEDEDVDFSSVPPDELKICFAYEFGREVVFQDAGRQRSSPVEVADILWLEDVVNDLRDDARKIGQINDFDGWIDRWVHAFIKPSWIIPVIYPEWPKLSYLKIPVEIRSGRAEKLKRSRETDAQCASFLTELREGDTHVTISIPFWLTHEKLRDLFAGLLRERFPKQGKGGALHSQGRPASSQATRDDLAALSVWRLTNRSRFPRDKIITVIQRKRKDGTMIRRYSRTKALDKPLGRANELIESDWRKFWPITLDSFRTHTLPLVLSDPSHAFERIMERIKKEATEASSILEK